MRAHRGDEPQASRQLGVRLDRREFLDRRARPIVARHAGHERLERAAEPRSPRGRPEFAQQFRRALGVAARAAEAKELDGERGDLALGAPRREQPLGRVLEPRRVARDAGEGTRHPPDRRGRHAVHRRLAERRFRARHVVRAPPPHEGREQERPPARIVGRELLGERLELRRERRRVRAVGQQVELVRARRQRARIGVDREREGLECAGVLALADGVLGDAQREGSALRRVLLDREAARGDCGGLRRVAEVLGQHHAPRGDQRGDHGLVARRQGPQERVVARSVQHRGREIETAEGASLVGGAHPRVDDPRRVPGPEGDTPRVASRRVEGGGLHERRDRLERCRAHLGPRARLVSVRVPRVRPEQRLELDGREPRGLGLQRARFLERGDGLIDPVACGERAGAVDEQ